MVSLVWAHSFFLNPLPAALATRAWTAPRLQKYNPEFSEILQVDQGCFSAVSVQIRD